MIRIALIRSLICAVESWVYLLKPSRLYCIMYMYMYIVCVIILYFQSRNIDLSTLRSCVIVSEERPRAHLINSFTTLFNHVGLDYKAVSTAFGCRVNPMICLQVHVLEGLIHLHVFYCY